MSAKMPFDAVTEDPWGDGDGRGAHDARCTERAAANGTCGTRPRQAKRGTLPGSPAVRLRYHFACAPDMQCAIAQTPVVTMVATTTATLAWRPPRSRSAARIQATPA